MRTPATEPSQRASTLAGMRYGLSILLVSTLLFATDAGSASTLDCRTIEQTFNSLEVACPMPAIGNSHAFDFVAHFSGGHDDTLVTIAPRIGDQAAPCAEGSRLRSFGEDGDIELRCTVQRGADDAPADLTVLIRWSHADYTDHGVVVRGPAP